LAVARRRRGWWFDVFRSRRTIDAVRWAIQEGSFADAPGIAWTPTVAATVTALGLHPFVFDSLDNWLIHPTLRRNAADARAAYATILPYADRVFTAAPASATALRPWSDRIEVVANGVDPETFGRASVRPSDLPDGPIVGYAGKLAERIDVAMCGEIAAGLPDVTFVFLGPIMHPSVRRLADLRNVRLLGDRHPSVLPAYVGHFDVAWIPHRVGEGETGGDPIKLYEYWAAGRQVVTTAIDGSENWRERAFVVGSPDEAARVISGLLAGSIEPKRVWVEPERTWGAIARRILEPLTAPQARRP
jgi:glycosyltransferase involved in cell wall biosynthesis